jgi:hypothetical protein
LNKLFHLLLSLLIPAILFGQYLIPDSSVLQINGVKKLSVSNCLDSSFCFTDEFEFNKRGLVTKEAPGIIGVYSTWDYYENGKLKTYFSRIHAARNGDSVFIADHYYYDENWNFKWIISDQYENARVISTDTIFSNHEAKKTEGRRNQIGQIIEQDLGDLSFPCAIIFEGRHRIYYNYYDNKLLKSAKVLDENDKLLINFAYNYEYY